MIQVAEITGLVIVGAALANAVVLLVFNSMRQSRAAAGSNLRLEVFREKSRLHLEAARIEGARTVGSWQGVRKFVVDRKVKEAEDIFSFYLKSHDQQPLPPFLPGQYLTFRLRLPDMAQPLVRCYSLSDSPKNYEHYRITVKELGARGDAPAGRASSHLARRVEQGDILDVMAPSGHFVLDEENEKPVVLIAGGVGLTPLLSMLLTIVASGSRRETWFFYGVRYQSEHAMAETLKNLAASRPNIHLVTSYSEPTDACRLGIDYDHKGFISDDLLRQHLPSNNFDYFICGPPPMMDSVTSALLDWGVPKSDIHFEAFGPASTKVTIDETSTVELEVEFARSATSCTWNPAAGSLLDIAESNDVMLDSGCRAGSCGSCLTAIREGEVEYTIEPGIPVREGSCLTCIARPKTKVVLDA